MWTPHLASVAGASVPAPLEGVHWDVMIVCTCSSDANIARRFGIGVAMHLWPCHWQPGIAWLPSSAPAIWAAASRKSTQVHQDEQGANA